MMVGRRRPNLAKVPRGGSPQTGQRASVGVAVQGHRKRGAIERRVVPGESSDHSQVQNSSLGEANERPVTDVAFASFALMTSFWLIGAEVSSNVEEHGIQRIKCGYNIAFGTPLPAQVALNSGAGVE